MATAALRDRLHSGAEASTSDRLAALYQQFPGRAHEISALLESVNRLGPCCLVYGPAATGKTAVVRGLLSALRLRHAYVNCNEMSRPRPLLCSVLHQLKGGKRQRDDGYECGIKCDSIAEFRLQLPGVVAGRRRGACWLVLDNVHRIAGSELLSALMRVREDTGADVGLLLVGSLAWASGRYLRDTAAVLPPKEVHFPGYTPDQLVKIMEQRRQQAEGSSAAGDAPAYRQFLHAFVPTFCRASNNLLDLQAAVAQLFPLYMQPLREGKQLQSHQLYNRIRAEVQKRVHELQLQQQQQGSSSAGQQLAEGSGSDDLAEDRCGEAAAAAAEQQRTAAGRRACSSGLAFELPYLSKFLLLAAYVASRNKPTTDRAVFDPTFRKRGRRDAQAHDRQVEAAVEAKLRGPHAFPLERLLHIFYAIYAHHDADDDEDGDEGQAEGEAARQKQAWHEMQQAEVLQQVSSLVALRLLEQSSGDVLEGQLYRCNLAEPAATALAANVRLRLTDYLKLS